MDKCKSYLFGLIFNCPFKIEIENCPFKTLREIETRDRIVFIETLSGKEILELLSLHQYCLTTRERDLLNVLQCVND